MEKAICEEWKAIQGYENLYEISNFGRIRSLDKVGFQKHWQGGVSRYLFKGQLLKPSKGSNGYMRISLKKDGKLKTFSIHRLVGIHFLEKPDGKDYINHLDADVTNNHVSNLEWCFQSENIKYAYDNGTKKPPHMKKIGQYDSNGNLLKIWESESQIERELHIYQSNIYKVCSGKRKQAGGYKWQYIE